MQTVILAGGLGSRLSEETMIKPKPLIEIGQKPIIWHLMKIYSFYGLNDFIVCCGYKGNLLKEYFLNFVTTNSDINVDLENNKYIILNKKKKLKWKISLIDTGEKTQTGGRIRKIKKYINGTFCMTYGDGLSDINIKKLIKFHKKNKKKVTMTVVNPPSKYGKVNVNKNLITKFDEKPSISNNWVNGGFFVLEPSIFKYLKSDKTIWESNPLKTLSKEKEIAAFRHSNFWQSMDTLREKILLNDLWNSNKAPWKCWRD